MRRRYKDLEVFSELEKLGSTTIMGGGSTIDVQSEMFWDTVSSYAEETAIICQGEHLTYKELATRIRSRISYLRSAQVSEQSWVSLQGELDLDSVVFLLALLQMDATTVLMPNWLTPSISRRIAENARPDFIASNSTLSRSSFDSDEHRTSSVKLVIPTSGSVGFPKLVCHSSDSLLAGLFATLSLQSEKIESPSGSSANPVAQWAPIGLRFLISSPLATIATVTVLQRSLLCGESLVIDKVLSPSRLITMVSEYRVTNLMLTPIAAQRLLREIRLFGQEMDSLLAVGIGGGPTPAHVVTGLEDVLGVPIMVGYVCTETAGPVLMGRPEDSISVRATSVGSPLRGVRISIDSNNIDGDVGQGSSVSGELLVSSPALLVGYLDSGTLISGVDGGGWFRTGDIASIDSAGSVTIEGRKDGVILRGADKIDPVEIEDVLKMHPKIVMAAVRGIASRVAGEQDIQAYIVLANREDREPVPTGGDLREWCRGHLPPNRIPRSYELVDEIPLKEDGSIRRGALRWLSDL